MQTKETTFYGLDSPEDGYYVIEATRQWALDMRVRDFDIVLPEGFRTLLPTETEASDMLNTRLQWGWTSHEIDVITGILDDVTLALLWHAEYTTVSEAIEAIYRDCDAVARLRKQWLKLSSNLPNETRVH